MKRFFCAIVLLVVCGDLYATDDGAMVYRYWDWGVTPHKDDYQVALLKLALDKTRDQYGPYRIERVLKAYSRARARREVNRGEIINTYLIPYRNKPSNKHVEAPKATLVTKGVDGTQSQEIHAISDEYEQDGSVPVMVPAMKGLLGYRRLIIRRSDAEKFSSIVSEDQLKSLVAGQGDDWIDIAIYQHNGYKVVAPAAYSMLFAMLAAGRFDYLPLGAVEAEAALQQHPEFDSLMIAPELIIYYPFPMLFHVSKKYPKLAARLELGMKIAQKDGSVDKLFEQYFSAEIKSLQSHKPRYFVLKNPSIPTDMGLDVPLLFSGSGEKISRRN